MHKGKSILVINAAGGVGSVATQLARWAGLTVIGTASRPESIRWVEQQGAHHVINHRYPLVGLLQHHGYPMIDYIMCLKNTAEYWDAMVEVIAPQGKICLVDDIYAPVSFGALHSKSATVVCENVFTRPNYQTTDLAEQHRLLTKVAELVDNNVLHTTLTERLSPVNASNLRQAHARVEQGSMVGKLVLEGF